MALSRASHSAPYFFGNFEFGEEFIVDRQFQRFPLDDEEPGFFRGVRQELFAMLLVLGRNLIFWDAIVFAKSGESSLHLSDGHEVGGGLLGEDFDLERILVELTLH